MEERLRYIPGSRGLWLGILVYRWISLAWMTTQAVTLVRFRWTALAWVVLVTVIVWNIWWTLARAWLNATARWIDLAISASLLLFSGLVQVEKDVISDHPFFATAYPATSAMTIGAASGPIGGLVSAGVLSAALAMSRPLNGVSSLTAGQLAGLVNGIVYYLAAGAAIGLGARVLARSSAQVQVAQRELIRERERAARLAERESIGRQIHDSVLQALALVNKRGRELAALPSVAGSEVARLAEMADEQERALRALVQREPDEAPEGAVGLRTVLQASGFGVSGVPVVVTTVDPVWLPSTSVEELSAAVHQALDNVVRHANASQAFVFGESEGNDVLVTIRDDGVGFEYDEERLRREGKLGVLRSMKGRIEDLGGSMRLRSAPGRGTEVEFRLPGAGGHSVQR